MIRLLFIYFFCFELLFGLSLTQEEKEWLKSHPVINVGYSTNFEPLYIQNDNGSIEGVIPDLYKIVASKLNIKINFKTNTWEQTLNDAKIGKIDVVPMMFKKTAENYGLIPTSEVYTHVFKVYGKSNQNIIINSLNDLKGLRVAYVKNILVLDNYLQKYKDNLTLIESKNTFEAFNKVLNNQADVAVVFNFNGSYITKKNFITELRPLYMIDDLVIDSISAVRSDYPELQSILNKVYDSITQDEKTNIFKKWISSTDHFDEVLCNLKPNEKELLNSIYFNVYIGNWEPFSVSNKNTISGISIDIWELIASKFNLHYTYVKNNNFNDTLESMKYDKNGIVLATAPTKDKEEFGVFSKTIMSFPVAVATNINEKFIVNLRELEGKTVAVGKNYSAHLLLQKHYPKIRFVPVENTLEALHLLNNGKVYAAADILPVLIYNLNKYNLSHLKISGTSTFLFDIKMMLNKHNQNVIPILNKFIDALEDADKQEIFNKWIYTKEIEKINYTFVYLIAFISICVIVVLMFRQKILNSTKKEIDKERNKYLSLMNFSSDMIFIMDFEGNLLEYSKEVQRVLGYTNDEMKTLSVFDWDKELTYNEFKAMTNNLSSSPIQLHRRHKKKDNNFYEADIQAVKIIISGQEFIYATVRDVTKIKELEQEIIKERDFVSTIIDSSNAIIAVINHEGRMIKVNKYAQEFTQYSQEEIASVPYFWSRFLPSDMKHNIENIFEKAKEGELTKNFKNSWFSKLGEERVFEWSNTLVLKPNGTMDYLATIGIDVTHQEHIQKQILEQKEEFESIFKYSTDGIAITDLETNFLEFNDAYVKITSYTREELLTKSSLDLSSPEHKDKMKELILIAINEGHVENYEKESIVKDGKRILVNMSISLLPDKKRLLIVTKDVTSLKLLEDQSRLAAMGEMIGNIAHQWRQPLSVITTAITGASIKSDLKLLDEQDIVETRDIIIKQANYLSTTIENFRNFIREDKKVTYISVKEAIENAVSLVSASLDNNFIKIILDLKDNMLILGNKNELTEAFINIMNNSKDILKDRHINEENRLIFVKTKCLDENTLEIQFLDNAGGIDETIMGRILEPYFTTKHKSQGTGLGLSISDKIIRERHHGVINVFNELFEYKGKNYKGFSLRIIFTSNQSESAHE